MFPIVSSTAGVSVHRERSRDKSIAAEYVQHNVLGDVTNTSYRNDVPWRIQLCSGMIAKMA
jgi:hypothetical protein